MKIGFISLGCAKNLVDSEMILAILEMAGCDIVSDVEEADAIFINTCGFIEPAKKETLETIEEMHQYGKKLIVTGCYAERYKEELKQSMPYIDRIITLKDYPKIHLILNEVFNETGMKFFPLKYENRLLTTSYFSPYVKISEGCNNNCTYCAIPLIRGKFHSRDFDEIILECQNLINNGAKEINLISQDTSRYGSDNNKSKKSLLPELLKAIAQIKGVEMVRFLYLYPDEVTDELLETVKENKKIVPYFDIPIQHISTPVLKAMNRRGDEEFIKDLLYKIRKLIPEAIIRTTYIVGFPNETEADFDKLLEFTEEFEFDRLGVFTYSKEEDTLAYHMKDETSEAVKQARLDKIMKLQKKISRKKNKLEIGKIHRTLVENYDSETNFYYGRSYAFAPDDIDGMIVFQANKDLDFGDFVDVKITAIYGYDLIGDLV